MHSYHLRPTLNKNEENRNQRITRRRQTSKALVSFKKPSSDSQPASGHDQYLQKIYATNPTFVNGSWCMEAAWFGLDGVYDEPISSLIHGWIGMNMVPDRLY